MKEIFNKSKNHWGNSLWEFIHNITIIDSNNSQYIIESHKHIIPILYNITTIFPCSLCLNTYKDHLKLIEKLDLTKPMSLFYWSVDLHNAVNKKLDKNIYSYEDARLIWCKLY